jgi:hypothetical protein
LLLLLLLLLLLVYWGIRTGRHLFCWRPLLMHTSICYAVALMPRKQACQEAGVQLWCVSFVDGDLRRSNRVNEALDDLVDLCFEPGRNESRAF